MIGTVNTDNAAVADPKAAAVAACPISAEAAGVVHPTAVAAVPSPEAVVAAVPSPDDSPAEAGHGDPDSSVHLGPGTSRGRNRLRQ